MAWLLIAATASAQAQQSPRRIVSLSLPADEIVLSLVSADRVVAVSPAAADPRQSHVAVLAKDVPVARAGETEAILAHRPDLVLAPTDASQILIDRLTAANVTVVQVPTPESLDGVRDNIRNVAAAVGEPAAGRRLVTRLDMHLEALRQMPPVPAAPLSPFFADDAWRLRAARSEAGGKPKPQRIVPLTFGATEVLLELVARERLAAVHARSVSDTFSCVRDEVRGMKLVSSQLEDILRHEPDLVVVAEYSAREMTEPLQRSGVAVLRLGNNIGFEETLVNIEILAQVTGEAERGRELVAKLRKEVRDMQARIPERPRRLTAVVMTGALIVAGSETTMNDFLTLLHMDNVAKDLRSVAPASVEQLLVWNPDVIIIGKDPATGASLRQQLLSEAVYAPLRAKRIVEVNECHLSCVSQYQVDAMRAIFRQVYE